MDAESAAESTLNALATEAVQFIHHSGRPVEDFFGLALHDPDRDEQIMGLPTFPAAVSAIEALPEAAKHYGEDCGSRLAVQLVYTLIKHPLFLNDGHSVFQDVWSKFRAEAARPLWTLRAITNLEYFDIDTSDAGFRQAAVIPLGTYGRIVPRSTDALASVGCDSKLMAELVSDLSMFGLGGFVLLTETEVSKTPETFVLVQTAKRHATPRSWSTRCDWLPQVMSAPAAASCAAPPFST